MSVRRKGGAKAALAGTGLPDSPVKRAEHAWKLRVAGFSWETVAEQCGYDNRSNAHHAVTDYIGTLPTIERSEGIELELARLEMLWQHALTLLRDTPNAATVTAAVKVSESRRRLLGLDAPTAVIGYTASAREIEDWIEQVTRDLPALPKEPNVVVGEVTSVTEAETG